MSQTQRTPVGLLVDGPSSGAWNMAVDEALLLDAAETGACWLRFYEWSEPTLSLGYFQRLDARREHAASRDCAVVRRASGGGAIVHDRELTYLLALPTSHRLASSPRPLYALAHEALIAALGRWRISPELCSRPVRLGPAEPFLCFFRRAEGDVVMPIPGQLRHGRNISSATFTRFGGDRPAIESHKLTAKICGSAQRRLRGGIAQHGSLLIGRSSAAPELDGLLELTGLVLPAADVREAWMTQLECLLGLEFEPARLSEQLLARSRALAIERYDTASWTRRR
jgi:lipoate-protein ligase A